MSLSLPEEPRTKSTRKAGTGLRFCKKCDNLLSPQAPEDKNDPLEYFCFHCSEKETAQDPRVYVNVLKRTTEQSFLEMNSVSEDVTLRRTFGNCPYCKQSRYIVTFQRPSYVGEETMSEMSECCTCHRNW